MKLSRSNIVSTIGLAVGVVAGAWAVGARAHDDRNEHSDPRVKRGFEVVPAGVYLDVAGKNRELIGLGSYLINAAAGCSDCHTRPNFVPGGDPYLGQAEVINFQQYLTGGRQFGPFVSANLRPDASGNPAGLTRRDFITTLRTGHNPNDPAGQILQVMPWPVYGKMIESDLKAIYEYLRALPSQPDNPSPGP